MVYKNQTANNIQYRQNLKRKDKNLKITGQIPKKLYALLDLLDEPDEKTFTVIRESILDFGDNAIPFLDEALLKAKSEFEYRRIELLKEDIVFNTVFKALSDWTAKDNKPVLDAWIILSRLLNNDSSEVKTRKVFGSLFKDIWLEFNDRLTALEKVKVINHILYKVYGFSECEPEETGLVAVAENFFRYKKGSPVTMAMMYLAVARQLFLPVYGVNLPQHLILAFVDLYGNQEKKPFTSEDVLFYINPYNRGAIFTRNEIELYLKQNRIAPNAAHFSPGTNEMVIGRYLNELDIIYKKEGNKRKQVQIERLKELV